MKKGDCAVCLSAGSVGKSGVCGVCGEEVEDAASLVANAAGEFRQTTDLGKKDDQERRLTGRTD